MQIDGVANLTDHPAELRRDAVGLGAVMMQALTDVASAILPLGIFTD
jgi:hypothetical protein